MHDRTPEIDTYVLLAVRARQIATAMPLIYSKKALSLGAMPNTSQLHRPTLTRSKTHEFTTNTYNTSHAATSAADAADAADGDGGDESSSASFAVSNRRSKSSRRKLHLQGRPTVTAITIAADKGPSHHSQTAHGIQEPNLQRTNRNSSEKNSVRNKIK